MCWKKHYSLISILVFCFQAFETDARKQWCMNIRYENPTEGCCGGVIYNRSRDQIDYECCNDNVYKRSEQTCCGRVLRNNTDIDQEDICCENQFHPKNKGVCCDNIFYRHGDKNHHSCCGKLLNDNNNKMCCNGKLHVGSKHPGKKCCGDCKDDSCCGTTPYNSKERTCTDNNQLLPEGNTPEPFWINMCGNKSIDETIQGCCNGTPFNLLNQICCGGTILHKSKKCCDGRVLDTAKYVCCNRETIEQQVKLLSNHDDCCLLKNGSLQTYNRKYYECTLTSGVIQNGTRCGPLLYNKSIDLCCQGILFKMVLSRKGKCCGVKSYDTECQECESRCHQRFG
ncbi:unnamed protein product [Mytilus coruscus]|uniref:Galaxin-like repeats domain-containing protein n=1 Tax=Mytilus coruscus TaxID=42192 RepID=A0A6J7ZXN9_MYTCO|nr:unnamed protein product [Mytilus coruscus]